MANAAAIDSDFEVGEAPAHDLFSNQFRYGDLVDWNHAAQGLHEIGPIHRVERKGVPPFWAVVDYAAIREIQSQPDVFTNAPRIRLATNEQLSRIQANPTKTLIHMDGEEHKHFRALTSDWFRLDKVRGLHSRLEELNQEAMTKLEAAGGEVDFATDIAMPYPLQVVLKVLGLPEEDFPMMLKLTLEFFGEEDPDFKRPEGSANSRAAIMKEFKDYFMDMTRDRRKNPTDDLASVIANGRVDGRPLTDHETVGYYILVATAGHDTTSSTMSSGLQALIENPDQLRMLQDDPGKMKLAVEEMIRWTSPVRHFMRTAQQDTEVQGQKIAKGDWLCLSFRAANYDPKVFADPLQFNIERQEARKHLAFGFGAHICLGNMLARAELNNLFTTLLPRLDSIELNGTPTIARTTNVGGHKSLPIKYTLKAA